MTTLIRTRSVIARPAFRRPPRTSDMPSMPPLPRRWPLLVLALSLLVFAAAAGHPIALPGLDYEEVLFGNAATGGENSSFIYRRLFGVPVLLMNYIGALKAYLFAPIF